MNKKTLWWTIGIVVVLLLIIVFAVRNRNNSSPSTTSNQNNTSQSTSTNDVSSVATTTPTSTPTTQKKPVVSESQAYDAALAKYQANGYRIQFTQCQGNPGHLAIKLGQTFMLDNRENKARTIGIKSQTFHLAAYGFAIATAKDLGVYNITCDGGGSMQLNVEK